MKIKIEIELTMEQVMALAEHGGEMDIDGPRDSIVYNTIAYIIDRVQVERIKMSGVQVTEYVFDGDGNMVEKK